MDADPFYRQVKEQLCQGDVLERVPLPHLKEMPCPLKKTMLRGHREGFELGEPLSLATLPTPNSGLLVPALCDYTRALVLTYDCEIDKPDAKYLTVALVRPLDSRMPDEQKALIRGGQVFASFHLPSLAAIGGESYVDFRRLACLSVDIVKSAKRVASLSDIAWKAFLFQMIRFLSRIDIDQTILGNLKRP